MENKEENLNETSNLSEDKAEKTSDPKKSTGNFIVWAVVILVVASFITFGVLKWGEESLPDDNEILAIVGGIEITMDDIRPELEEAKAEYLAQGFDITQEEGMEEMIILQIVQSKVHQKILMKQAEKLNLEIDDEQVEEEYQTLIDHFGGTAQLEAALEEAKMTEKGLKENIHKSLLIRSLAQKEGDLDITEEDIQEYYNELLSYMGEGLPPLEEIRDQLEQELLNERISEVLDLILMEIEGEYNVQIFVEMPEPQIPSFQPEANEQGDAEMTEEELMQMLMEEAEQQGSPEVEQTE